MLKNMAPEKHISVGGQVQSVTLHLIVGRRKLKNTNQNPPLSPDVGKYHQSQTDENHRILWKRTGNFWKASRNKFGQIKLQKVFQSADAVITSTLQQEAQVLCRQREL